MKVIYFIPILFLFSCTPTEQDEADIESMHGRVDSEIVDMSASSNERDVQANWIFYEGRVGIYEQQVVIELGISDSTVSGRYFYARHQRFLALEGTYDTLTKEIKLIESYRGKITGYINCIQDVEGNLEGTWSKLEDSDKEPFAATRLELNLDGKRLMNVRFEKYTHAHEILVYNGISNEPAIEKVVDEIVISHINDRYLSFHYSVIGGNAHLGSMDGIAQITEPNLAEYQSPQTECLLRFSFTKDSIAIVEEGDCSSYRGMRAHFGNTLGLIK
ncbi:MAG: hypothetical protein ACI837_001787 [Crocinitomicaceae bacterium]|jgi:hypothetical protein